MKKVMKKYEHLETIVKGFASKRRIAVLALLARRGAADVETIAEALDLGYKSTSEHLRKMHIAGLIEKEGDGYYVMHSLTPRGTQVLRFLKRMR